MTVNQEDDGDPFIGQVLDGKYRIDVMLGQGGMGMVYRATHILMDHPCAVKVLHSKMMADPSAIPRFQREARAAARIRHQNAIAVNDFGITSDNVVYLVMEFFPGQSLREIIRGSGALTVERTVRAVERVAAALDAAHRQGIIHRDVKPDNIMLRELPTGEDEVKVLDFGIAKIVDQHSGSENLTITGTIIGTPHYLSPEQCRAANDLDARSDLYSLAIVTYEMLAGTPPFMAATPIAVAMMHISDAPPSLVEKVPDLPPAAEAAIFKALSKKREDRQPSTVEFAQDLYAAVFGFRPENYPETALLARGGTGLVGRLGTASAAPQEAEDDAIPTKKFDTPGAGIVETVLVNPADRASNATPSTMASDTGSNTPVYMETSIVGSHTGANLEAPVSPSTASQRAIAGGAQASAARPDPHTEIFVPPPATHTEVSRRSLLLAFIAVVALASIAIYYAFFRTHPVVVPTPQAGLPPAQTGPAAVPPGMSLIPDGTYMMGRNSDDPYEGPPHEVSVKSYYLDKTEVTNQQYAEFVEANNYPAPQDWKNNTFAPGTADVPVVHVTWQDARAYAKWAHKRLPTEAEWEYAARGTDGRLYPWGDTWIPGAAYTNESKLTKLQPVGTAPEGASPFGVLDMAGNVWEWCEDNFSPYPGSKGAPKDVTFKIVRGGSLGDDRTKAISTYRAWYPPEYQRDTIGFRCARSIE